MSDLTSTVLRDAKLDGTTLREANLTKADLRGASLGGVDLREATLKDTRLDLPGAVHLAELYGAVVDDGGLDAAGARVRMPSTTMARPDDEVRLLAGVVGDRAGAAGLAVGLLVADVAEHEVQQRPRGDADQRLVEPAGDSAPTRASYGARAPRPKALHGRDQLGAVAIGQHASRRWQQTR